MGGTPSCDSLRECPIRACNFSKHEPQHINIPTKALPDSEKEDLFRSQVHGKLNEFLSQSSKFNLDTINTLESSITSKNIPTMDINATCIGFDNAVTEKFTNEQPPSLIGCVIASILVIAIAILIWRFFVSRNAMRYQQPASSDQTIAFPVDDQW